MISITGNIWEEIKTNNRLAQKIKQDFKFSENISKLLVNRNFSKEEIFSLNNSIDFLNPFLNNFDFINSKKLILDFIIKKKKIMVIGDYDVDGTVSTSMLINFFKNINHPCDFYIPDRFLDGYGVSKDLFKKLNDKLTELIIIVDSGSKSHEAIKYLNSLKIKSIIIDHHEIYKPFPKSNALINPKKFDKVNHEQKNLCASALVYFLIDILNKELNQNNPHKSNLFLTALATICDVMPLRGLNRNIVMKAFKDYNYNNSYFINYLLTKIKKTNNLDYDDFGYLIGPILNSGGRLNKSNLPIYLMTSSNKLEIEKVSNKLMSLNNKRKEIEKQLINEIREKNLIWIKNKILIVKDLNIPEGLIGIIATRFLEKFNKSTIVITQSRDLLKGSARSTSDINIGSIVNNAVIKKILVNGGGHQMAAGLSIKKNNFNSFKKYLEEQITSDSDNVKTYNSKISSSSINKEFVKDLYKLAPFGNANKKPVFFIEKFKIFKPKIINNSHIHCLLKDSKNKFFESFAFNSLNTKIGDYLLNYKNEINIMCEFNLYGLKKDKINIHIVDIIV